VEVNLKDITIGNYWSKRSGEGDSDEVDGESTDGGNENESL
jgi:hypothetical protein